MIDETIRTVLATRNPSGPDNRVGFVCDAEWALQEQSCFRDVQVRQADNPLSLVNATMTVGNDVHQIQELSDGFAGILQALMYMEFHASSVQWYQDATVLRFVTLSDEFALCTTGTFLVRGGHYDRLRELFERDFEKKLPELPDRYREWAWQLP